MAVAPELDSDEPVDAVLTEPAHDLAQVVEAAVAEQRGVAVF